MREIYLEIVVFFKCITRATPGLDGAAHVGPHSFNLRSLQLMWPDGASMTRTTGHGSLEQE
jgi:hypothetical protein